MMIDWFTVAAQVINFLILVWLLKRYLYQPILHAIDARETRIAGELSDAAKKKAEATTERELFQQKNNTFDEERAGLLQQATEDANTERSRLLAKVQQAAVALHINYEQTMASDARNFKQALSRKASEEVFAIVRKALRDLASISLEECITEVFIQRLHELDSSSKVILAQALSSTSKSAPALVRSRFELNDTQRAEIQHVLNDTFSADIPLQFEIAAELISGIELSANGQKLAWTIAEYLVLLEQGINELLQEKTQPIVSTSLDEKSMQEKRSQPAEQSQSAENTLPAEVLNTVAAKSIAGTQTP